jgi:hypothetical protein
VRPADHFQAVMRGAATIDDAVDALLAIEQRHGVAVHTSFGGISDDFCGVWRPRPGQEPLSLGDLVGPPWRVAADVELEARYALEGYLEDDAFLERLFPFLTESGIVLSGMAFANDHFFTLDGGAVAAGWGQRGWSDVIARWAKREGLRGPFGQQLDCAHFYSGMPLIAEYDAFRDVALACIRAKTVRLVGPQESPSDGQGRGRGRRSRRSER